MQPKSNDAKLSGRVKWGLGGIVLGGAAAMILGFTWGGWVSSSTHQEALAHQKAVYACVQDVILSPQSGAIQVAVAGNNSAYQRRRILNDHDISTSSSRVADECADAVEVLDLSAMNPRPAAEAMAGGADAG